MMKLQYIFHDCFLFENEKLAIVFDFWKDPVSNRDELPLFLAGICRDKPLYVLVSHHHKDHYTKRIFEWVKYFPHITYILSKDVAKFARHILRPDSIYNGIKPPRDSVKIMNVGDVYKDDLIKVDAFGSTDIGNSYGVRVGDTTLFHAGDLNAWIWKDESTEKEVNAELSRYNAILDAIVEKYPRIELAMFPVDSRIGTDYFIGARMFVRKIDVAHFFPMHFALGIEEEQLRYRLAAADVEKYANPDRGDYICLQSPHSCFIKS